MSVTLSKSTEKCNELYTALFKRQQCHYLIKGQCIKFKKLASIACDNTLRSGKWAKY